MSAVSDIAWSEFAEGLVAADSLEEAVAFLTEWVRRLTGAETVLVRMAEEDDEGGWLPVCGHDGGDPEFLRDEVIIGCGECICGVVARGGVNPSAYFTPGGSFLWGHVQHLGEDLGSNVIPSLRGRCVSEGYQSVAVSPLLDGDRPVGSLHMAARDTDLFASHMELLERAGSLAGRVLIRHRERQQERAAFSLIQEALLPPKATQVPGLGLEVSFQSATTLAGIGGDFYEVLDLGESGVLLLVGDYSGKGLEAAGWAARARYTLAALARLDPAPTSLLSAGNASLAGSLPPGRFVSCLACLIDPDRNEARLALAGHPAPLLLRRGAVEELEAPHRPPLGVLDEIRYEEVRLSLERDDVLVLYTDGVTDSRRRGALFGVDGIARACRTATEGPLSQLVDDICRASASFHDADGADDRLVLAVALAGGSETDRRSA
jgi:serine phosphatase RsbU (regulator of sigma subunit)